MFGWVGKGSYSEPDIRCFGEEGRGAVLNQISGIWVGGRGKLSSTRYQVFGWVGEGSYSEPDIWCLGGWEREAVLNQISGVWVGGEGELF